MEIEFRVRRAVLDFLTDRDTIWARRDPSPEVRLMILALEMIEDRDISWAVSDPDDLVRDLTRGRERGRWAGTRTREDAARVRIRRGRHLTAQRKEGKPLL